MGAPNDFFMGAPTSGCSGLVWRAHATALFFLQSLLCDGRPGRAAARAPGVRDGDGKREMEAGQVEDSEGVQLDVVPTPRRQPSTFLLRSTCPAPHSYPARRPVARLLRPIGPHGVGR